MWIASERIFTTVFIDRIQNRTMNESNFKFLKNNARLIRRMQ